MDRSYDRLDEFSAQEVKLLENKNRFLTVDTDWNTGGAGKTTTRSGRILDRRHSPGRHSRDRSLESRKIDIAFGKSSDEDPRSGRINLNRSFDASSERGRTVERSYEKKHYETAKRAGVSLDRAGENEPHSFKPQITSYNDQWTTSLSVVRDFFFSSYCCLLCFFFFKPLYSFLNFRHFRLDFKPVITYDYFNHARLTSCHMAVTIKFVLCK